MRRGIVVVVLVLKLQLELELCGSAEEARCSRGFSRSSLVEDAQLFLVASASTACLF